METGTLSFFHYWPFDLIQKNLEESDEFISRKLWSEANLVNFFPFLAHFGIMFLEEEVSWHFITDELHPRNQKNMMTAISWKPWFWVNLVRSSRLWTYFKVIQTFRRKRALLLFTNDGSLNLMQKLRKIWYVNYSDTLILSKFESFLYHLASPKLVIIKSLCHF